jgi:hypothetical protein
VLVEMFAKVVDEGKSQLWTCVAGKGLAVGRSSLSGLVETMGPPQEWGVGTIVEIDFPSEEGYGALPRGCPG